MSGHIVVKQNLQFNLHTEQKLPTSHQEDAEGSRGDFSPFSNKALKHLQTLSAASLRALPKHTMNTGIKSKVNW